MENLGEQLYQALIFENRWLLLVNGLLTTLAITGIGIVLGIALGSVVAIAKVNAVDDRRWRWLAVIGDFYTTVVRGTPMVLQLLIMYFVVFGAAPQSAAIYVAGLTFGINSGAYVSEIIRAGILSIDRGQMEAGRSLGMSRGMTMRVIIFPQAIRNILPALGNEFITLFKETSVVGYVAVMDLTRAADFIRMSTYQPFVPLIIAALIYLSVVLLITWLLGRLEKKLAESNTR